VDCWWEKKEKGMEKKEKGMEKKEKGMEKKEGVWVYIEE
jgi:hypothetical protein